MTISKANRYGARCGGLRLQLHKPHVAISQPRALTPQSSVAVTITYLMLFILLTMKSLKPKSSLSAPENRTQELFNALANWAGQSEEAWALLPDKVQDTVAIVKPRDDMSTHELNSVV